MATNRETPRSTPAPAPRQPSTPVFNNFNQQHPQAGLIPCNVDKPCPNGFTCGVNGYCVPNTQVNPMAIGNDGCPPNCFRDPKDGICGCLPPSVVSFNPNVTNVNPQAMQLCSDLCPDGTWSEAFDCNAKSPCPPPPPPPRKVVSEGLQVSGGGVSNPNIKHLIVGGVVVVGLVAWGAWAIFVK